MKIFYLLGLISVLSTSITAQVINPSFENWTTGEPDDWLNFNGVGDITDENGNTIIPAKEETTGATEGNSYIKLTSFNLANTNDPVNLPNGIRGSVAYQSFNSTDKFLNFELDITYDIKPNDTAVILIDAFDNSGSRVGSGKVYLGGSQTTLATVTVDMSYDPFNVASYKINIASSEGQVLASVNSTIAPGSWLAVDNIVEGIILQDAPNVTNVIASDVNDNHDGSDLEVSFDIPDETKVSNYYVIAMSGITPADLGNGAGFILNSGNQTTTTGSDQTYNFTTAGVYWRTDPKTFIIEPTPIVENVEMKVYILVEGASGYMNVYEASNLITLTSPLSLSDQYKEISIYPNPAINFVNFKIDGLENGSVSIISVTGQELVKQNFSNGTKQVDISKLNSGVYFYTIRNKRDEIIKTNKLVVRK
ncbi:T9SS type A sorting domain-containing protein [Brumimicrobium glaciale]|uniref:T9SS type A sorting domain-containing protein n=1 Tax=Brumimicrobium glaciale TaxID=200475 RepID=A0A4V1WFV4_9FLAO|nr:T9SS type A sorting domain-containing protein [Brumimicrobium glaciale]RYM34506.1 T9SS type A sorting domain-containing protein [Brumimicrobium glaciale]